MTHLHRSNWKTWLFSVHISAGIVLDVLFSDIGRTVSHSSQELILEGDTTKKMLWGLLLSLWSLATEHMLPLCKLSSGSWRYPSFGLYGVGIFDFFSIFSSFSFLLNLWFFLPKPSLVASDVSSRGSSEVLFLDLWPCFLLADFSEAPMNRCKTFDIRSSTASTSLLMVRTLADCLQPQTEDRGVFSAFLLFVSSTK